MIKYKCVFKVTNKAVKCLGMYIGHDKEECYNKNWIKIYHDTEKQLFEYWKKRKLTLFGKTCVINTLKKKLRNLIINY